MKIAVCQFDITYEKKEQNLIRAERFIMEAAVQGAELIVFPEMSFTGFSMNTELTGEDQEETLLRMKSAAANERIAVGFGWVKHKANAENHYTIVGEDGIVEGDYIKIHPFSYAGEEKCFAAGKSPCTFIYKDICFGISICYDLRFPELYQELTKQAHVILVPANWPEKRHVHWQTLLRARAIENQVYMIGVNCCGMQGGISYSGHSSAVNPEGEVLFETEGREALQIIEILDDTEIYRKKFPTKKDRKPSLYKTFY